MRRAPSCLLFAGFLLSFGVLIPEGASAGTSIRHGAVGHHRPPTRLLIPTRGHSSRHVVDRRGHGLGHNGIVDRRGHGRRFEFGAKRRHRFFPHHVLAWPYLEGASDIGPIVIEQGQPPASYPLPSIPSVADLPVSGGIRSAPAGSPTVYVLNGGRASRSSPGAKALDMNGDAEANDQSSGPRIIHLDVPVGRKR